MTSDGSTARGTRRNGNDRIIPFDRIAWQLGADGPLRQGLLLGMSRAGITLLVERPGTPSPGVQIVPVVQSDRGRWRRPAVVIRVEAVSGLLDVVAARYEDNELIEESPCRPTVD
ncbi:MAG: hypothetical protein JXA69_05405 [Phycisphaerae bacterium]|nr:hypothetical protein [Phycisphaerae bacterium]